LIGDMAVLREAFALARVKVEMPLPPQRGSSASDSAV